MFSPREREGLRAALIEEARADRDVVGAALVGSVATGREDAWSDIDLVLQVSKHAQPSAVADRWTAQFYDDRGAVHHVDVVADGVLYRVFLLKSSLQVDVSFWPEDRFGATEVGFTLIFGTPQPPEEASVLDGSRVVGMAWLYALHARSAINRGRPWQAVMMLDSLRDQILVLCCLRHGLNPHHGREADRLPTAFLKTLTDARAASTDLDEIARSNAALLRLLSAEANLHDPALALRLAAPLRVLTDVDS
jgi:predicted nucleotidyltransferase